MKQKTIENGKLNSDKHIIDLCQRNTIRRHSSGSILFSLFFKKRGE
jgi:hypothetical protein